MRHLLGSAIRLFFEPSIRTGTSGYINYIEDPTGTQLVTSQAMSSTTSPSVGFYYVWQTLSSYVAGKYTVRFKAINGIYDCYKDQTFYLLEK